MRPRIVIISPLTWALHIHRHVGGAAASEAYAATHEQSHLVLYYTETFVLMPIEEPTINGDATNALQCKYRGYSVDDLQAMPGTRVVAQIANARFSPSRDFRLQYQIAMQARFPSRRTIGQHGN